MKLLTRAELLARWNKGWNCFSEVLNNLRPDDLSKTILIRNEKHTVMEAINRQLTHYAYHIGQIIFIAKMVCDSNWKSLTIPRGESKSFQHKNGPLSLAFINFLTCKGIDPVRRLISYCIGLILWLPGKLFAQHVIYSESINTRSAIRLQVIGRSENFYWAEKLQNNGQTYVMAILHFPGCRVLRCSMQN